MSFRGFNSGSRKRKTESWRRLFFAGASLIVTATAVAQVDEQLFAAAPEDVTAIATGSGAVKSAPGPISSLEKIEELPSSDAGVSDIQGAIKLPKVYFVEPKNGAVVPQEVKLEFGIEGGLKVEKAGEVVPGEGHFHVLIDSKVIPRGQLIPVDSKHVHFPNGAMEATVKLKPGRHKLTLLFGTGTHVSYGEMMSRTIEVQVK